MNNNYFIWIHKQSPTCLLIKELRLFTRNVAQLLFTKKVHFGQIIFLNSDQVQIYIKKFDKNRVNS